MLEGKTEGGVTPLMYAIQGGSEAMIRECISIGMNPHAADFKGKNCQSYASQFKDPRNSQSVAVSQLIDAAIVQVPATM